MDLMDCVHFLSPNFRRAILQYTVPYPNFRHFPSPFSPRGVPPGVTSLGSIGRQAFQGLFVQTNFHVLGNPLHTTLLERVGHLLNRNPVLRHSVSMNILSSNPPVMAGYNVDVHRRTLLQRSSSSTNRPNRLVDIHVVSDKPPPRSPPLSSDVPTYVPLLLGCGRLLHSPPILSLLQQIKRTLRLVSPFGAPAPPPPH